MWALGSQTVDAEDKVQLSFASYPAQQDLQPYRLRTGEKSTLEINAANQYISDPLTTGIMDTWTLGLFRQRVAREKEFVPLASCKSLKSRQQILILGHPIIPHEDEYLLTAIDGSTDHFNYGSFLFLNLTGIKLTANLDKVELQIEPGRHTINSPKLLGDEGYIQAQVFMNKDDKKKGKKILDTRWPVHRDVRSLIIFYNGANDRILMHTIRQPSPGELSDS